jgi:hypothetical protein
MTRESSRYLRAAQQGMKLTSVERIVRSQPISGVEQTKGDS